MRLSTILKYNDLWRKYRIEHGDSIRFADVVRYFPAWLSSQHPGRSPLSDKKPWIVFPAIHFLHSIVKDNHHVFEYGMGGSTLFFLNKQCHVVSVEHDENWFEIVRKKVYPDAKWNGLFVPPTFSNQYECDDHKYISGVPGY